MMPLVRSAIRRATHKGKDPTLLVAKWRSRDRSE
jgi:hypothetical protein